MESKAIEVNPEVNTFSGDRKGKRRLASKDGCMHDLKKELQMLFNAFYEALAKAQPILDEIPVHQRSGTLEPALLQTFFAGSVFREFEGKAMYGKYKRLILSVNNYVVLFKKLNAKGLPMNIKTNNVQLINNQSRTLDLFANADGGDSPILYFGYKRNKFGVYKNPQLIYIDEEKVRFSVTEQEIGYQLPIFEDPKEILVKPELKPGLKPKVRKAN